MQKLKIKKSDIFWTIIFAVAMVIFGLTSFTSLIIIWFIWSAMTCVIGLTNNKLELWMLLSPITCLVIILYGIIILIGRLHVNVIVPFNKRLNKED